LEAAPVLAYQFGGKMGGGENGAGGAQVVAADVRQEGVGVVGYALQAEFPPIRIGICCG